uniref:Uncharacterized protein n=1 Tax=Plectus sambesii TaxID=2011161 RepID=A0A914UGH2_9BILA
MSYCHFREPENVTKNATDLWIVDIDVVSNNLTEHATKNETGFRVVDIDIIPPEEAIDALSREAESSESVTSAPGVQLSLDEEPKHVTKNETDLWVVDNEAVSDTINANETKNETDLWVVEIDVVPSNITENVTKNETDFTVADIDVVPVNVTERNDIIEPAGVIANIESDSTQGNSTETAKNNDVKVPQTEIAKKKTNIGILALLIALLVVALTIFVIIGCIHWFRKQESLARTAALEKDVVIIAHKKSAWSASGTTPSPSPSPKHSTDTSYSTAGPDGPPPVRVDDQGKLTV